MATLDERIGDLAAGVIGSGRKPSETVIDTVLRGLVLDVLERDGRFAFHSGLWELTTARDERHRAITGEPVRAPETKRKPKIHAPKRAA